MRKTINYFKTYEIEDLKDMLIKTTDRNKKSLAFRVKEKTGIIVKKTYQDFKLDVEALATRLIDMGLKNKRIAVMGKNSYAWAVSYLAATIIGIVVPVDKESSNQNVKDFLNTSKSEAMLADTKFLNEVSKFKDELAFENVKVDVNAVG